MHGEDIFSEPPEKKRVSFRSAACCWHHCRRRRERHPLVRIKKEAGDINDVAVTWLEKKKGNRHPAELTSHSMEWKLPDSVCNRELARVSLSISSLSELSNPDPAAFLNDPFTTSSFFPTKCQVKVSRPHAGGPPLSSDDRLSGDRSVLAFFFLSFVPAPVCSFPRMTDRVNVDCRWARQSTLNCFAQMHGPKKCVFQLFSPFD